MRNRQATLRAPGNSPMPDQQMRIMYNSLCTQLTGWCRCAHMNASLYQIFNNSIIPVRLNRPLVARLRMLTTSKAHQRLLRTFRWHSAARCCQQLELPSLAPRATPPAPRNSPVPFQQMCIMHNSVVLCILHSSSANFSVVWTCLRNSKETKKTILQPFTCFTIN